MRRRRDVLRVASGGVLAGLVAGQGRAATRAKDVYAILERSEDFLVWKDLVDRVGLASRLQDPGPLTLSALTDYALSVGPNLSIPPRGVSMKPDLRRRIRLLVEAHIVEGAHDLAELSEPFRTYPNLAGGLVTVSRNEFNITLSWDSSVSSAEGTLSSAPSEARNGLVYAIGPLVAQPLGQ